MSLNIVELAAELEAMASAGKMYTEDVFDIERYNRLTEIAQSLLSEGLDIPQKRAEDILDGCSGYRTPKVETRVIVFDDEDRLLMVRDWDGKWAPPGGWCEYNMSIKDNCIKEAYEEAGIEVVPVRLAAVFDHRKNNNPKALFGCCKFFVICKNMGGSFKENTETSEVKYFSLDELPEDLNTHKCQKWQLELCLEASKAEHWNTYFD